MNLQGIIYVSGMSGLYKVTAKTKNGFIVESLTDKKRVVITASQRVSALEDISVYATANDLPLKEVLLKIKEKTDFPDTKSDSKVLKEFFESVVPDYDKNKVYDSDIKKILTWYSILKDFPEYWENKETAETEGDKKPIIISKTEEKHFVAVKKNDGKANTHGAHGGRQVMTQNRGGG